MYRMCIKIYKYLKCIIFCFQIQWQTLKIYKEYYIYCWILFSFKNTHNKYNSLKFHSKFVCLSRKDTFFLKITSMVFTTWSFYFLYNTTVIHLISSPTINFSAFKCIHKSCSFHSSNTHEFVLERSDFEFYIYGKELLKKMYQNDTFNVSYVKK